MEWFDIKGYEGLYQINKNGEVRSLPHYTKFKNGTSYHIGYRILKNTRNDIDEYLSEIEVVENDD